MLFGTTTAFLWALCTEGSRSNSEPKKLCMCYTEKAPNAWHSVYISHPGVHLTPMPRDPLWHDVKFCAAPTDVMCAACCVD